MVAVVDKLERLGYAHRVRSATDRRKHVVTLSPRGERTVHEVLGRLEQVEAEFLAPLSPAEQRQLNALVGRLFAAHNQACEPS
jgi:DNA-binding MarR family transcriptional regulator